MQKRVVETNRKRRKATKKDAKMGKVKHTPKDPVISNSWPFQTGSVEGNSAYERTTNPNQGRTEG
jgi:hypothetical protein